MAKVGMAIDQSRDTVPRQDTRDQYDADKVVREFRRAVDTLTGTSIFHYAPAYWNINSWGQTWRGLEFHLDGLTMYNDHGDDLYIDGLQLFIAMYVISLAPNLVSVMRLGSLGHAFWGVPP